MTIHTPAARDYFAEQVREIPAFRALIRAIECRLFDEVGELAEPLLDLGCGDGHFAGYAYKRPPTVGIDVGESNVREARTRHAYQSLAVADASRMPFADGAFATVTSNCVIEHIPDVEAAMAEISRVLQPGGRLIFGVPSDKFGRMLLAPTLLRRASLGRAARAYGDWFNRISIHYTTDSTHGWHKRLARHGFAVDRWQYYMSPAAMRAFDVAHYLGVPRLVSYKLTGKWMLFPNPIAEAFFRAWLGKYAQESNLPAGACIFFDARKVGESSAA
jgi:ubiquinone/menaquinone biosynthesis C-methylase UbiE